MNEAVSENVEDGDGDGKRGKAFQGRGCLFLCLKRLFLEKACAIEEMGRRSCSTSGRPWDVPHALQ